MTKPTVAETIAALEELGSGNAAGCTYSRELAAAVEHLRRMAGMRDALKAVEWQLPRERPDDRSGAIYAACPECAGFMGDGHFDGCKLAAALAVKEGDAK